MRVSHRVGILLVVLMAGCESFAPVARGVDRVLDEAIPAHPVTGAPMVSVVPESREIARAQSIWAGLVARDPSGASIDPPSARLDQISRVFGDLVSVSHRQHLPWQVHLVDDRTPNAVALGGGLVIVSTGLFTDHPSGEGFVAPDDEELAAVLAHEIAHNTMMHIEQANNASLFSKRARKDAYYRAAYTTEHEAEADRIGLLYMALAGYDPSAAAAVWQRAHRKQGSSPGKYLYDHPLNAQRAQAAASVAQQLKVYYVPGQRNPDWAALQEHNVLYRKAEPKGGAVGTGTVKAAEAAMRMYLEHRRTRGEAKEREQAAQQLPSYQATMVRLLESRYDPQGRALLWLHIENGSKYPTRAIGITIDYLGPGNRVLWQDSSCGGTAQVGVGRATWFTCQIYPVQGAQNHQIRLSGVDF